MSTRIHPVTQGFSRLGKSRATARSLAGHGLAFGFCRQRIKFNDLRTQACFRLLRLSTMPPRLSSDDADAL
ncbi:MAG: hypothetical protein ACO3TX_09495, partial [Pseudomonadales bacterium]